jgi:hypothetical protein
MVNAFHHQHQPDILHYLNAKQVVAVGRADIMSGPLGQLTVHRALLKLDGVTKTSVETKYHKLETAVAPPPRKIKTESVATQTK